MTLVGLHFAIANATQPPQNGTVPPEIRESFTRIVESPDFGGYARQAQTLLAFRTAVNDGFLSLSQIGYLTSVAVSGNRSIPVIPVTFTDVPPPYDASVLQDELFEAATGTIGDYYREVSGGRLTVSGVVLGWQSLRETGDYYEGGERCWGLCPSQHVDQLVVEAVQSADATVDFGMFDNDGFDGIPNSGDDDGVVDFVAFVHPESGGECDDIERGLVTGNIWSHRYRLSWAGVGQIQTNDLGADGTPIRIDDYVIQPALDCDGQSVISIGVFVHEFGHAFGLPDLYDTDYSSEGIGNWGLMGSGSYGGDGQSPWSPVHLTAWSKSYLGWISTEEIDASGAFLIEPVQMSGKAWSIRVDRARTLLLENREDSGYDSSLVEPGLLIWLVDQEKVNDTMSVNRVNSDEQEKGVALIEADGNFDLDAKRNRADAGDPFPGATSAMNFSQRTLPVAPGAIAICDIMFLSGGISIVVDLAADDCSSTP